MPDLVKYIRKRLILQVLLFSLPVLFFGLFTTVQLLQHSFSAIMSASREVQRLFQDDVLKLEQNVLELTDQKYDSAARIAKYEADLSSRDEKETFLKKGYEIWGEIFASVHLSEKVIHEFTSIAGQNISLILNSLNNILGESAFAVLYWDREQSFKTLAERYQFSTDFADYLAEAVENGTADTFEDNIESRDIVVSLIPYAPASDILGVFITVFDVSKSYSYFDQAERVSLSVEASRLQEQRLLEGKRQREILEKVRAEQNNLIAHSTDTGNEVISNARSRLILLIDGCMIALIGVSIFSFWWLGIRQVSMLKKWLGEITSSIRLAGSTKKTNALIFSPAVFSCPNNLLAQRLRDHRSQDEIGELIGSINYMLTTLEQTSVSKNRLQAEIDEKIKIETQLRENQQRLKTIFDSVQAGVAIIDASSHTIVDINPAALQIIRAEKNRVIGSKCYESICTCAGKSCPINGSANKIETGEQRMLTPSGESIDIIKTETKIELDGQKFMIASFVDITEIKNSRIKLEQAMHAAEKANRVKSEFLANMSHEIRTPLNGVIGMTQIFAETKLDEEQLHLCQTINNEAESLLKVINEILDFSKIEAGKIDLEYIPFSLGSIVEQVSDSIAIRVDQKGLEVLSFVSPELPTQLIGDPSRLKQILTNLSGNALKFTQKGEIYITVEKVKEKGNTIYLQFSVNDTGMGIPREKLTTIFDSFTQADGTTTRKYGGTGLGTTISKQLVELMGGEIGVESIENEGSTFWFTIPFEIAAGNLEGLDHKIELQNLNALVIDDNATNRFILKRYLRSWGCSVELAADGRQGVEKVKDLQKKNIFFDFIILDCHMPEMNGLEVATCLRNDACKDIRNTPLVILSSANPSIKCDHMQEVSIQGFIKKPVKRDDLERIIKAALISSCEQKTPSEQKNKNMAQRNIDGKSLRSKFHILLVEDYPTNQKIALRYLSNEGYRVDIAENGVQAVEFFSENQFDLILMDIHMPLMDGLEATGQIRGLEKKRGSRRVPIIAMTAYASKDYQDKCLAADMDDYVAKPLRKNRFVKLIDTWLVGNKLAEKESGSEIGQSCALIPAAMDYPPFDIDKAMDSFMHDADFLGDVIDGFLVNLDQQFDKMETALKNDDFETLWTEAHTIKGGAYNLYAEQLGSAALNVEKAGKAKDSDLSRESIKRLRNEAVVFLTFSQKFNENCKKKYENTDSGR